MPELRNLTPYPNFRYYSRDRDDREFGVIVVKATFELSSSERLVEAEEQAPMVFTDLCHGAVNVTSLWHPSDMVPNKPATDVLVNAVARPPGGRPTASWQCGIRIKDGGAIRLEKRLRVTGPRSWRPVWKRSLRETERSDWRGHRRFFDRWELSEPEPTDAVPLRYEYAYGGEVPQGEDENGRAAFDTDHRNPLGCGKIDREWTDHTAAVPAPRIEDPDAPVGDPYAAMRPEGLGPIPPAWLPRRPLGGTYDRNWKDNIWPAWPPDYDFAYHNSAHPDLVVDPYLRGTERISLTGLASRSEVVTLALPGQAAVVDFAASDGTGARMPMALDTVFLDIASARTEDWRVFLSWRVNFEPGLYEQATILRRPVDPSVAEPTTDILAEGRSAA